MTVSAKEYSALERKHLKVTSEMYSDIQKLREEKAICEGICKGLLEDRSKAWDKINAIRKLIPLFDEEADKNDEAEVPILWLKRQLEAVLEPSIESDTLRKEQK